MPQISLSVPNSHTERVRTAIANASAQTGVGFDYLFNQARIESALNPEASSKTSTAQGLFQFTRQTWLASVKTHGAKYGIGWAADAITRDSGGQYRASADLQGRILDLRNNPELSSSMAAELASDNQEFLSASLDKPMEPVDLYLGHFLGAAGAQKFLTNFAQDPDQPAAPLLPVAAAANRSIFYNGKGEMRSLGQIRSAFAKKFSETATVPASDYTSLSSGSFTATTPTPPEWSPSSNREDTRPLELMAMEPMPSRLSLDFARKAYQRLAHTGRGEAA